MRLNTYLVLLIASVLCASPVQSVKRKPIVASKTDTAKHQLVAATSSDTMFLTVKVGPQQSASWIAFRHLGAWTPEIAAQIRTDNKEIKNLDQIEVGQSLLLRRSLDQRLLTPSQQIAKAIRKAVATYVKGAADVTRLGRSHSLHANEFLMPGDRISTRSGAVVELIIDNQSVLRLRDKTTLSLVAIQDSGLDRRTGTRVFLEAGQIWTKVRKWAGPLVGFQVKMPNAIAGVHGTTFECFVNGDSSGFVSVHEGLVGVTGRAQPVELLVAAGKIVFIKKDGQVSTSTNTPKTVPGWNHLNQQRDDALEDLSAASQDDRLNHRQGETKVESSSTESRQHERDDRQPK